MAHSAHARALDPNVLPSNETSLAAEVVRHLTHEIRQPLSTIESAAYYVKLVTAPADSRVEQQLERIQQMVDQVNCILSDAVQYLQTSPPRPQLIDLMEIIDSAVSKLGGAEIEVTESLEMPLVRIDPGQAAHMVRAMLGAFHQIAGVDGTTRISLAQDGAQTLITCSCPAPAELRDQAESLFQPFSVHLPCGAGLAFAGVRKIVEAHGGSAEAQDDAGQLTLRIILPA